MTRKWSDSPQLLPAYSPAVGFCYFWRYCTFDKIGLLNPRLFLSNLKMQILKKITIQNAREIPEFKCCTICMHLKIAKYMCRKISCYKVHIISALWTTVVRFVSDQLGLLVISGWPYFFSSEMWNAIFHFLWHWICQ